MWPPGNAMATRARANRAPSAFRWCGAAISWATIPCTSAAPANASRSRTARTAAAPTPKGLCAPHAFCRTAAAAFSTCRLCWGCSPLASCVRRAGVAPHHRLGLQLDAIALRHVALDGGSQPHDLAGGGAAAIDQHQCLPVVHAGRTQLPALPAALVDQPARGQLETPVGLCIRNQPGMPFGQRIARGRIDQRILEEAARIAD